MSTKRQVIESLRKKLQEAGSDSTFSNQFLYNSLMEQAQWLIRRETMSGKIYTNNSFFQTLGCQEVVEQGATDCCCPVKTHCKVYRLKDPLPELWLDDKGPVIRMVTSVDGTTEFVMTTPGTWQNKRHDPYQKMIDTKYVFFHDNYLWFPEHNPHRVNIDGFYTHDISDKSLCREKKGDCIRFLDTSFQVPEWLHAEMLAKTIQLLTMSKQIPEDQQPDKNPNRKN
jgi:hypothetical protein